MVRQVGYRKHRVLLEHMSREPFVEEWSGRKKQITSLHTFHPIRLVPLKKRLGMTRLKTGSFSSYELVSH